MLAAHAADRLGRGRDPAAQVVSAACRVFGLSEAQLQSSDRGDVTTARWAIAYVLVERLGWAYARIGRLLCKDHAAIIHGHRRAAQLMREDEAFFDAVQLLEQSV